MHVCQTSKRLACLEPAAALKYDFWKKKKKGGGGFKTKRFAILSMTKLLNAPFPEIQEH